MALTGRLQFIYENLLPGAAVWDFCCDHGYLGIEALRSKSFSEVHFVDQVPHIIQALEKQVSEKFPEVCERARFLALKGEDIEESVTGTVVVAGVGAFAIYKIIKSLWSKGLLKADRLILCPQRDQQKLLRMLSGLGEEFLANYPQNSEVVLLEKARERFVYVMTKRS